MRERYGGKRPGYFRDTGLALLCSGLLALAGCGEKGDGGATVAAAPADAASRKPSGLVTIPPNSPKLQQLRVEGVRTAEVAIDEVISPGKIEVNPSGVSRIVLPAAGRIASVLVKLGDAVEKGQTVLTLESPDVDAVASSYLQAGAALAQANANLAKAQTDFGLAARGIKPFEDRRHCATTRLGFNAPSKARHSFKLGRSNNW